jgi:putative transposase
MYELPELRELLPWLAEVPRDACNQVMVRLDQAWQRCFKGLAERPCFKRKGRDKVSVTSPDPRAFRIEGKALIFPKLGSVEIVQHRPLPEGAKVKSCAITRDVDQWFASIQCEIEVPDPLPSTLPTVAIDRGVTNLIADSDGRLVPGPRPMKRSQKKVADLQRAVARKEKGSKNQQKAKVRVARAQRKVRRQRDAVLHHESRYYAKNHGCVVVEDLHTAAMTKSARGTVENPGKNVAQKSGLNRAILDSAWRHFETMVQYKIAPLGGDVMEKPAYNTSIECARCHEISEDNRKGEVFLCVNCGHRDHADTNAAKVLLSRRTDGGAGWIAGTRRPRQQLRVVRRGNRMKVEEHQASTPEAPAFRPG